MKLSVNAVIQTIAVIIQGTNQVLDAVPPKAKFWVLVGVSALQGITAVLAHFVNPDGTPAAVAYEK